MSAQVTEAHRELARRIMFEFTQAGTATASDVRMAAQIIADSEAKATAEWQEFVHLKGEAIDSLLLECDRLRAEVERLKRDYDYDHKCLHEVRERCELWKQRAERAEAELHALRLVCGTTDADKFSTWVDRANARAEKAEAELATERARLRQIALDACRSAKITPIVWYPKRYAIDPNDFGIINEQQVEACAQAIDVAMKEGA